MNRFGLILIEFALIISIAQGKLKKLNFNEDFLMMI